MVTIADPAACQPRVLPPSDLPFGWRLMLPPSANGDWLALEGNAPGAAIGDRDARGSFGLVTVETDAATSARLDDTLTLAKQIIRKDGRLILLVQPYARSWPGWGSPLRRVRAALSRVGFLEEQQLTVEIAEKELLNALRPANGLLGFDSASFPLSMSALSQWRRRSRTALICRSHDTAPERAALSDILQSIPGNPDARSFSVHRGSGGIYRVMTASHVLRFPSREAAVPRTRRNYHAVVTLRDRTSAFDIPRAVIFGNHQGLRYFVESRVPGTSLEYLREPKHSLDSAAVRAVTALLQFQRDTMRDTVLDDQEFKRLFGGPSRWLGRFLGPGAAAALEEYMRLLRPAVLGRRIALVFVHGDFKVGNLLWTPLRHMPGVVDWDLSMEDGLPVIDYIFYWAFDASVAERVPFAQCLAQCLSHQRLEPQGDSHARFCRSLGLDPVLYDAGVIMSLVHYGTHHPGLLNEPERVRWCAVHLSEYLENACDNAARALR